MRNLIKFVLHAALVTAFAGLATAAFIQPSMAKHSPTTSGVWLVMVDWDERGQPSIEFKPVRFDTPVQCASLAPTMVEYLNTFDPDRRYVMVCAVPDDEMDLDAIIDSVIEDFRPYFISGDRV